MERIAVIGLGYVGLPVALAFARRFEDVVGLDIHQARVSELKNGIDRNGEENLDGTTCRFTDDPSDLASATFYIVTVPTPIDTNKRPDLGALRAASRTVGAVLKPGDVVVYESTVYPGVTEEICAPILEETSKLTRGVDFKVGYSPERINPGDPVHRFETIKKVVSGEDAQALRRVSDAYGRVVTAGVHEAPSIGVAEAAKVIENTQRDLNIALINELAVIFERLGISTSDVLAAAGTKWNFLKFTPGFVGGHCIGVDPYYLTARAEQVGYHPQVILAGRRVNDGMGRYVAQRVIRSLNRAGIAGGRVGVLGVTFKEDVPDIRNSRVVDIIDELNLYGCTVVAADPMADAARCQREWGVSLHPLSELTELDALVVAVPHQQFRERLQDIVARVKPQGIIFDVKSALKTSQIPAGIEVLSL
jgi:UDP-N-acetyl-D-glucosamine/UDP-N-acetyl-D-galactosamine dehydrogenase